MLGDIVRGGEKPPVAGSATGSGHVEQHTPAPWKAAKGHDGDPERWCVVADRERQYLIAAVCEDFQCLKHFRRGGYQARSCAFGFAAVTGLAVFYRMDVSETAVILGYQNTEQALAKARAAIVWLGIRRITNDLRRPKNKCKNLPKLVDNT